MPVKTKCIYEPKSKNDGYRVLVMRLWPRGISKDKIDIWVKDLGTPPDLIKKWKSGSISWAEFSKQYRKFATQHKDKIDELALKAKKETITLLCSCRDGKYCHRALLEELITGNFPIRG
ncbi:MAG: DUF488 family protein [Sedimentisphaerales bacterium]